MHDLDSSNKDILVEIDTASDEYLRKVRDLSPGKRKAEMEKIQVKIHRCANDGLIEGNFTWIFKFQSAAFNLVIWRKYEGNKPHFIFKIILKRNIKPPPVWLCVSENITLSRNTQYLPWKFSYVRGVQHCNISYFYHFWCKLILFSILQRMFKKSKEISDDKVNIAVHTYELVDKHIRKLDADLAKFESEMKVKYF